MIGQGDSDPTNKPDGGRNVTGSGYADASPTARRVGIGFGEALYPNDENSDYMPVVVSASTGGAATGQGQGSYGYGFNYGSTTRETQGEVNRASDLSSQRAQDLFMRGDRNNALAQQGASLAGSAQDVYRQQGATDFGNQQMDRGATNDALGRLRTFYEQGPDPSAAETQLRMASDQNMANAIALARSGRGAGAGAAAMRNAMFSNAASQQQLGGQMAQLRAQEAAAWRQQQLGAMGLEQGTLGTMRGQDIASMGSNAQTGLGYGNLGLGYTQAGMQNQLGYSQLGSAQNMEGERLRQQILGQQLQANVNMRGQDRGYQSAQLGHEDNSDAALWGGLGALAGGVGGFMIGGPVGAVGGAAIGSQVGSGIASSDIRAKKGVRGESVVDTFRRFGGSMGGGDKKPAEASPENPMAREGPQDYGTSPFGSTPAPGSTFQANDRIYRVGGPDAVAPWEMGISPFAQQAPLNTQRQTPIDFYLPTGIGESDREAKEQVRRETLADVFGALDRSQARATADTGPSFDLRPAQGYSYEYKNPAEVGAEPGRHYGPMAQDLMKTPAGASTVTRMPNGKLGVDTGRLAMVNTAAISEQQSQLDRLRRLLDEGQAKAEADTGPRLRGYGLGYGGSQ